jgi:replication-associated recombination protein RarA
MVIFASEDIGLAVPTATAAKLKGKKYFSK